jgi:3-mercaptopyruvate sulfurtransferase SseA
MPLDRHCEKSAEEFSREHRARRFVIRAPRSTVGVKFTPAEVLLENVAKLADVVEQSGVVVDFSCPERFRKSCREPSHAAQVGHQIVTHAGKVPGVCRDRFTHYIKHHGQFPFGHLTEAELPMYLICSDKLR